MPELEELFKKCRIELECGCNGKAYKEKYKFSNDWRDSRKRK